MATTTRANTDLTGNAPTRTSVTLAAIEKGDRISNERSSQELYELLRCACNKIVSDSQVIKTLNDTCDQLEELTK